jgi:hypothetical protein
LCSPPGASSGGGRRFPDAAAPRDPAIREEQVDEVTDADPRPRDFVGMVNSGLRIPPHPLIFSKKGRLIAHDLGM